MHSFYVFQLTEIHYQIISSAVLLDGCGLRFSPEREILSFVGIGACRVGMSFCLCGGLCFVGPLLVGHSFRWRFLIGSRGGACCAVLSVLHILFCLELLLTPTVPSRHHFALSLEWDNAVSHASLLYTPVSG